MDKKQLEEIEKKCKEIRKLIKSNESGSHWIKELFEKFDDAVLAELKDKVWNEYREK